MDKHIHTDECWEPDSGCDMGRNEEFVRIVPEEEAEQIDSAIREVPAYIRHPDTRYNAKYDCYYNVISRQWLEEKCGDDSCEFCSIRPELAPLEE